VVLWSGLAVGSAHAQDRVQFEVMVAQAFDREGSIDPSCQELSKRLPMRYGTIRMVRHRNFDLDLGKAATVQLPSGRLLSFLPIQVINRRLHLQYRMSNVVNTRLQLVSGKPVILGGEPFDGGFLIVQLTPSFAAPETHSVEAPPADLPRVKRVNARD
jgi:hypothetical protein